MNVTTWKIHYAIQTDDSTKALTFSEYDGFTLNAVQDSLRSVGSEGANWVALYEGVRTTVEAVYGEGTYPWRIYESDLERLYFADEVDYESNRLTLVA